MLTLMLRNLKRLKYVTDSTPTETSTTGAATRLKCSPPTVHSLVERGELPCRRTETGQRIFRIEDVEKLAMKRKALRSAG
jgi:DNA-binding transcriptional MerR regulator